MLPIVTRMKYKEFKSEVKSYLLSAPGVIKDTFGDMTVLRKFRGNSQKLDRSKIRLVVYVDHDKGRSPMFDSDVIKPLDDPIEQPLRKGCQAKAVPKLPKCAPCMPDESSSQKSLPKYHFSKLGSDSKVLEEMMFGSVAMAYKGASLKVHFIRSPPQIMLSKVFQPEKPKRESCEIDSDSCSLPSQVGDFSLPRSISTRTQLGNGIAQSMPMAVPSPHEGFVDSMDDDSGLASFTSSGSFHTPVPSPSGNSASSYNSLHRRWMRTQTTSLQSLSRKTAAMDQLQKQENSVPRKRKSKLALGILFGSSDEKEEDKLFQNFFFSHITLFEGHIEKLGAVIERAYFNRRNFIPMVMEALAVFRNDIHDLYTAPRLADPVWLNMMSFSNHRYVFCEKFINEFMSLAAKFDNKSTNFFVSTLVSAVLTHHLAWVPTVTPAGGTSSRTYLDKHSAKWLDTLAKTHPYNPLWAQLGDLYGAIGFPLKLARTVVVGKKQDIVKKFLYILSYFIRCSDVHERTEQGCLNTFINDVLTDTSPSESEKTILDINNGDEEGNCNNSCSALTENHVTGKCNCVKSRVDNLQRSRSRTEEWLREMEDKTYSKIGGCIELTDFSDKKSLSLGSGSGFRSPDSNGNVIDGASRLDVAYRTENTDDADPSEKDSASVRECRLSAAKFVESLRVENISHVRKDSSAVLQNGRLTVVDIPAKEGVTDSKGSKVVSVLSKQLESDHKMATSDLRKMYLKEGSNSMFDEYFQEGIETKTIDDVAHLERVVKHPLASSTEGELFAEDVVPELQKQQRTSVSRQNSMDKVALSSRPSSLAPGRCRSVTPTELGRRRHLSSASSAEVEPFDPMIHCKELSMPDLPEVSPWSIKTFDKNFGRSLLAGYSDHYMSDFVLHGTSDQDFRPKMLNDIQLAAQNSVLDEPIGEAVCIVADTDNWTVEVASSRLLEKSPSGTMTWMTSQLVCNLVESVLDLWRLKMSPEFCLMHLEDRLQEIYFKSKMLAEYVRGSNRSNMKELTSMLGFDTSDHPLLVAIAGTHSPSFSPN